MKKRFIFFVMPIFFCCTAENRIKEIELDFNQALKMHDLTVHGDLVIGLDQNEIIVYQDGSKKRRTAITPKTHIALDRVCIADHKLFFTVNLHKLLFIHDFDSLITEKKLPFHPWDIAPWQADSVLVLGRYNGKIFHAFDSSGNLARSFGAAPEEVHPLVGPRRFFIKENCIYVAGILNYTVYQYRDGLLNDMITAPEPDRLKGPVSEKMGEIESVLLLSGISGMGIYDDILYVSTYHHNYEDMRRKRDSSAFYLEAFDLKTEERVFHLKDSNMLVLLHTDGHGVYLLKNQKIIHWRGLNDKNITF